jgi:DNA-binding NtrC family response regulator
MQGSQQVALVLDDDASSRFVFRHMLEREGFAVIESGRLGDAIESCRSHPGPITLWIADVVLRGENGSEGLSQLRGLLPGLAVLFVSGYPLEELQSRGMIDQDVLWNEKIAFLQKPFTIQTFRAVVRDLIDTSYR